MNDNAINENLVKRAFVWMTAGDAGSSSKAILGHMLCGISDGEYPYDPADLGRCLRLLENFRNGNLELKKCPLTERRGKGLQISGMN